MFIVVYRGNVKPEKENEYPKAWKTCASLFVAHCGALRSKLFKNKEGNYVAISFWPDKTTRDAAWHNEAALTPEIKAAVSIIKDSLESYTEEFLDSEIELTDLVQKLLLVDEVSMKNEITYVSTDKAAKPMGHYSQAVIYKDTIYIAAQLGIVPHQQAIKIGTIEEQVNQALKNVEEILIEANSSLNKVLKVTIYVADISLWDKINELYIAWFGQHKPARAVVPVKELHLGFQVAFDVIAAV